MPYRTRYHINGRIRTKIYYSGPEIDDTWHRVDGPAYMQYNTEGILIEAAYYVDDILHRIDGPAIIDYHNNGNISSERYIVDSTLFRADGPARIEYTSTGEAFGEKYYFQNGEFDMKNFLLENDFEEFDDEAKVFLALTYKQ